MNKILGDKEIEIGGKKYIASPTFKALMMIEGGESSLAVILARFGNLKPKATDIVLVIHSCISAHNSDCPSYEEIGEMIHKQGYEHFITVSVELVASLWSGAPTEKKTESEVTPK